MAKDKDDERCDRAPLAVSEVWRELEEFLRWEESVGPAQTADELDARRARFIEIVERTNARAREAFERLNAGDPTSQLNVGKRKE